MNKKLLVILLFSFLFIGVLGALQTNTPFDETIFVLVDGTRPLTGAWDAGNFEIRARTFESDVTGISPPFTIASTTMVTNLNSQLLGGKKEDEFILVNGTRPLTANWAAGNFKISAGTLDLLAGSDQILLSSGSESTTTLSSGSPAGEVRNTFVSTSTTLAGLTPSQTFLGINSFSNSVTQFGQDLQHYFDPDTKWTFLNDRITGTAGNLLFLSATEAAQDILMFGTSSGWAVTIGNVVGTTTFQAQNQFQFNIAGNTDIKLFLNGTSSDGLITFFEDENVLEFANDVNFGGNAFLGKGENYSQFDVNGILTLHGNARVLQTLSLGARTATTGATAPTSAIVGTYPVLQFSQNPPVESAYFTGHVPDDWDHDTNIIIHIHWAPTTGGAGDVVWDVDFVSIDPENNEVLTAGTTDLNILDSAQGLQDELLEAGDLIIPANALMEDHVVGLKLSRNTSDPADTYGASASFVLMHIEYIANKLGE